MRPVLAPLLLAASLSSSAFDAITRRFQAEVDAKAVPGAVVMLAQGGKVVYEKALGVRDPARRDPMPLDAIFRLHSMTKPITSVAAMMLVEEGKLALDEPVTRLLPELASMKVGVERVPAQRQITVRDLMTHRSGFPYPGSDGPVRREYQYAFSTSELRHNDDFILRLSDLPLMFHPGSGYEYGYSTDVLGVLVERASGRRLDAFIAERILEPLGMKDTGSWVPRAKQPRMAEPFPGNALGDFTVRPGVLSGGGGMVGTARDYLRFLMMLANGGELDGVRILSAASIDQLRAGAMTGGRQMDEGAGAAGTSFWIDPKERMAGVVMVQAPGARLAYARQMRELVRGGKPCPSAQRRGGDREPSPTLSLP